MLGALGRAWLSEPAVEPDEVRSSTGERTARRAVPTCEGYAFEGACWHVGTLTRGDGKEHQRPGRSKGDREPDRMLGAFGRAWLSEPAVEPDEIRSSTGERTARRAVPTQGRLRLRPPGGFVQSSDRFTARDDQGAMGTAQKVSAARPFVPRSKVFWLQFLLSR